MLLKTAPPLVGTGVCTFAGNEWTARIIALF